MNAKTDKKVIPGNEDDTSSGTSSTPEELAKIKSDAETEATKIKAEATEAADKIKSDAEEAAAKIKNEAIEEVTKLKSDAVEVADKIKSDADAQPETEEKVEVKEAPTLSAMRESARKQVENAQKRAEEEKGKD